MVGNVLSLDGLESAPDFVAKPYMRSSKYLAVRFVLRCGACSCPAVPHPLPCLSLLQAELSEAAIAYLQSADIVSGIEEDVMLTLYGVRPAVSDAGVVGTAFGTRLSSGVGNGPGEGPVITGAVSTEFEAPWQLDRTDQRSLPLDQSYSFTQTGAGVDVYVLDSGILATHEEFTGRVDLARSRNFANDQPPEDVNDCNGHGTHVASLAAGTTFGIAKAATIISVRVYDCSNMGPLSQALDGIDWTLQQMRSSGGKRAVINMSFGGPASSLLNDAIQELVDAGGVVVTAAGNDAVDACGVSPASAPAALTVAASTQDDIFAPFSNFGACVDIIAPGAAVPGAGIGCDTCVRTLSGTSMATPVTAGAAAAYLQRNPDASVSQATRDLKCSATADAIREIPSRSQVNLLLYSPPGGYSGQGDCSSGGAGSSAASTGLALASAVVAALCVLASSVMALR